MTVLLILLKLSVIGVIVALYILTSALVSLPDLRWRRRAITSSATPA